MEEAVREFVRLSQQIHGCKAALAELPEEPISYGWLGLDFWLLADDDEEMVPRLLASFQLALRE